VLTVDAHPRTSPPKRGEGEQRLLPRALNQQAARLCRALGQRQAWNLIWARRTSPARRLPGQPHRRGPEGGFLARRPNRAPSASARCIASGIVRISPDDLRPFAAVVAQREVVIGGQQTDESVGALVGEAYSQCAEPPPWWPDSGPWRCDQPSRQRSPWPGESVLPGDELRCSEPNRRHTAGRPRRARRARGVRVALAGPPQRP
jgi:hypothetical protein